VLSSSPPPAGCTVNWFVGNNIQQSENPIQILNSNTAAVLLTSARSQDEKIPIHVRLTDLNIKLNGPVYYFDDLTGEQKPYSFYDSSILSVSAGSADPFKQHIHIRPYPKQNPFTFIPAFSSSITTLPFDYSNKEFQTRLLDKPENNFLYYTLSSTTWKIETNIDSVSRSGNWSYQTNVLPNVNSYRFAIGYTPTTTENIPFLKISSLDNTTITNTVSALVKVEIQEFPFDWYPSTQVVVCSSTTIVESLPYVRVYAPSYIAIKDFETTFEPVQVFAKPTLQLQRVVISSDNSLSLTLTGDDLSNKFDLTFTRLGTQTISAAATFFDTTTNSTNVVVNVIPNVVEVVKNYDSVINTEYYHTPNTKLTTTQPLAPLLSPNEWVTEDTINNVIEKFYTTLTEIINHTSSYSTTNGLFYAWLGSSNYRWADLVCEPETTDKLLWSDHTLNSTNGFALFWNEQACNTSIEGDTSCLQKYCLEWNWLARKRENSSTFATWSETKKGGALEKKWQFEPCETDSVALACDLGKWHVSTLDLEDFPLKFCGYSENCFNRGCIEIGDYLVLAKKTELNLITNNYNPKKLNRSGFADNLFGFADIQGMCTDGNKIYVLDSLIPKVSIYEVKDNKLVLTDSWGKFGFISNGYGFNRPKDISIDQNRFLYVTDTGNKCIKKYTIAGKYLFTFTNEIFDTDPPLSTAIDSSEQLHVLLSNKVVILNQSGNLVSSYELTSNVINPTKISNSYNREILFVTHQFGIEKFFKNGVFFHSLINNMKCSNGDIIESFTNVFHTIKRDLYVCVNDKLLKFADQMKLVTKCSPIPSDLYWPLNSIKIHKDEYIQSWVYMRAFHRLWDNVELIRNSLHYNNEKRYTQPAYFKHDFVIGQNEIVVNSVINRLSEQLWANIQSLINYFK
jgi:hypothetical protein